MREDVVEDDEAADGHELVQVVHRILVALVEVAVDSQDSQRRVGLRVTKAERLGSVLEQALVEEYALVPHAILLEIVSHRRLADAQVPAPPLAAVALHLAKDVEDVNASGGALAVRGERELREDGGATTPHPHLSKVARHPAGDHAFDHRANVANAQMTRHRVPERRPIGPGEALREIVGREPRHIASNVAFLAAARLICERTRHRHLAELQVRAGEREGRTPRQLRHALPIANARIGLVRRQCVQLVVRDGSLSRDGDGRGQQQAQLLRHHAQHSSKT
eukprot:2096517-Prymnesium_polylepis.3